MAASTFFIPPVNMLGTGSLQEAIRMMASRDFQRSLIVTDSVLVRLGIVADIQNALLEHGISSVVYDGTSPNPTTENVSEGLRILSDNHCDSVISLGGGHHMTAQKALHWLLPMAEISATTKVSIVLHGHNCR